MSATFPDKSRGRGSALASLETQGFTGEGGTRTASQELASRCGWATSAIYRESGNCSYPGCTYAISSSGFCNHHRPKKPEKSDKCRVCGQVFKEKARVTGGACMRCYSKPDAVAARKKATAEKMAAQGQCSTPGCNRSSRTGRGKCDKCLYPKKSKYDITASTTTVTRMTSTSAAARQRIVVSLDGGSWSCSTEDRGLTRWRIVVSLDGGSWSRSTEDLGLARRRIVYNT